MTIMDEHKRHAQTHDGRRDYGYLTTIALCDDAFTYNVIRHLRNMYNYRTQMCIVCACTLDVDAGVSSVVR